FRARVSQYRCRDFRKCSIFHKLTDNPEHFCAFFQHLLHFGSTQIKVAVTQADILTGLRVAMQLDRQWLRAVQDGKFTNYNFETASLNIGILQPLLALLDGTSRCYHVFITQLLSNRKGGSALWLDNQ